MLFSEAEVAPLYDSVYRSFIGLVSLRDYIQVINMFHAYKMPISELPVRSIGDILSVAPNVAILQHAEFNPVDAEDTVYQLCLQFIRSGADYIPVVDPDNGNLVAVLGLLDIMFLLSQISQEFQNLFAFSVSELGIGDFEGVLTASSSTLLVDVLRVMDGRGLSYMPVLDESSGQLIGLYRKSNVAFITTAPDSDAIIANFSQIRIGDVVRAELPTTVETSGVPQSSPDAGMPGGAGDATLIMLSPSTMPSCSLRESLKTAIDLMVSTRSCAVPFLNSEGKFCGILTARDILRYYCST
jgi:CBS domain-containing protein